MTLRNPIPVSRTAGYMGLVLVVAAMATWGFWIVSDRKNEARYLYDVDWGNQHLCPNSNRPELNSPLTRSENRPDEELLWSASLKRQEVLQASLPDVDFKSLREFKTFKSHFLIEVRRTVLEFEASKPLDLVGTGPQGPNKIDKVTGVQIHASDCFHTQPQYSHQCAREAVLDWYAKQGKFPVNSVHHPKSP